MQHPPRCPTDNKQEDDDRVTDTPPERPALTAEQRQTVDFARHALADARLADLGTLDPAALILLVERLRARLDDVLQVLDPE